jgi:hypothetical protein
MNNPKAITATELYKEVRALAHSRGFAVSTVPWLRTVKAFSEQLDRSKKSIEQGGWTFIKHRGGRDGRRIEFIKLNEP